MKFSICIPNYNYAGYLARTLGSVLEQSHRELEVLFCDNASTDNSVEVVRSIRDPRIKVKVNACNVGFAGNLDKVVQMAGGDLVMVVSSDDLLRPGILELYETLYRRIEQKGEQAIVCSANDVIGPDDQIIGDLGPDKRLFRAEDRVPELEEIAGAPVFRVASPELLRRSLDVMANPFHLTSTAYPRSAYERLEGYGATRNINPDKWFHWRLLGVTDAAYYVDKKLAASRVHPLNQNSQQAKQGALKYLVDEYMSTFQMDGSLLERLGLSRTDLERRFVEYDIARHGLATLATGDRAKARRIVKFGQAVYPQHALRNEKVWALKALILAGPLGDFVSKAAYRAYLAKSPRSGNGGEDRLG
jgi:glycosyltransferase involved in cell wall biosynthesis